MLKKLFWKSIIFTGIVVALLFFSNNKILSQGLDAEKISEEENIPAKEPLTVKYISLDIKSSDKAFKQVKPLNIELQKQDKAVPPENSTLPQPSLT
ncbi:MAG: hypothetical protein L0956_10180, partial [Candidatus Mariimomonas ferrooxydans]